MYAMDFAQVGANIQRQLDIKGMTQQSLADALQMNGLTSMNILSSLESR